MADEEQKRSANLARIRDNQRRSRARRKEYLAELEVKFRQCEQQGAEASAEMQAAARKVLAENKQIAEENRRLRALLAQHGLSDAEIELHMDKADSPHYPSPTGHALESLLGQKRPCLSSPSAGGSMSSSASHRQPSIASGITPSLLSTSQSLPSPYSASPIAPGSLHGTPTPQYTGHPPHGYLPNASAPPPGLPYGAHHDDPFMWNPRYPPPDASVSVESSSAHSPAESLPQVESGMGYPVPSGGARPRSNEQHGINAELFDLIERYRSSRPT